MRKAVVPYRYVSAHDIGAEVRADEHWHSLTHCSGKLTKEDFDKALAASAREEYGYDVAPGVTRRRCLIAALKAAGIEVED